MVPDHQKRYRWLTVPKRTIRAASEYSLLSWSGRKVAVISCDEEGRMLPVHGEQSKTLLPLWFSLPDRVRVCVCMCVRMCAFEVEEAA